MIEKSVRELLALLSFDQDDLTDLGNLADVARATAAADAETRKAELRLALGVSVLG